MDLMQDDEAGLLIIDHAGSTGPFCDSVSPAHATGKSAGALGSSVATKSDNHLPVTSRRSTSNRVLMRSA